MSLSTPHSFVWHPRTPPHVHLFLSKHLVLQWQVCQVGRRGYRLCRDRKSPSCHTLGCVDILQSYHPTWSKTEYDRTPLEPPAEHERLCVLPERNSRAISSPMGCFGIDPSSPVDERFSQFPPIPPPIYSPTNFLDLPFAFADDESEDESTESTRIATPPLLEEVPATTDDVEMNEDHAWEECMQRRRMMFASMCGPKGCQPEFEGYRSVSSTLADILRNMGCTDDGDCLTPVPEAADACSDFTPADDCGFGVTLQRLNHLDEVDEEMPSMTSSSSSETDSQLESPQMGMVGGLVGNLGGMLAGLMVPKIMVDMDDPEGAK